MRRTLAVLGVALAGHPLAAQAPPRVTAGLVVSSVRSDVHLDIADGDIADGTFSGTGTGVEFRVAVPHLAFHVRYLEGRLDSDTGSSHREFVDGEAMVEYSPRPWLGARIGPHARVTVTPNGRERWVLWEAKARAEGALFAPAVHSYVEVWRALSASVNVGDRKGTAQGGEVGMVVRLARRPAWGRIGYRVERAKLQDGTRSETLEMLVFAFGVTLR